ncbi:Protein of unknown function [Weissella confusa LBAE C39-2]|nr:Protein of unknown function [Weissella confusa LBAE C39-2]
MRKFLWAVIAVLTVLAFTHF